MALNIFRCALILLFGTSFIVCIHNAQDQEFNVKFSSASNVELMARNGKHEYDALMERRRSSPYGQCWAEAILKLEKSCHQLDENIQSWLAVSFTHCFLKTSGLENELSAEACQPLLQLKQAFSAALIPHLKDCVKSIDMRIFHTYSLFYVHTQSICFYLHSEQWQKNTENLVDALHQSAQSVSKNLNSAVGTIHQLEELQHSSLKAQLSLNEELAFAKNSLQTWQEQTKEQRDLLEKIIDQFVLLRQAVSIEFSSNSAVVYYIFSMLVIYFVTTPQRVQSARLVLYLMLALNFVLEKKAIDYLLHLDLLISSPLSSFEDNFAFIRNVWTIRKAMLFLMTGIYIWWMLTYRDISQINYKILNENTLMLRNIQNQLLNSPEGIKPLSCFSDQDSDTDELSSSSSSYSDYESDYSEESFTLLDDLENDPGQLAQPQLRSRENTKQLSFKSLPKEYENESVNDFARNLRSSLKKSTSRDKLNYYSSDEN